VQLEVPNEVLKMLQDMRNIMDPEKNASQGEIENAAAILSRKLLKYNLRMEDLDRRKSSEVTHTQIEDKDITYWKKELAYVLASSNNCKVMSYDSPDPASDSYFVIVGRPENVSVAQALYEWLSGEYPKWAKDAWLEARNKPIARPGFGEGVTLTGYIQASVQYQADINSNELAWMDPKAWRNAYISGMTYGLATKLAPVPDEEDSQESINALVSLMDEEVDEYIADNYEVEYTELNKKAGDAAAYAAGIERGFGINTNQIADGELVAAIE
jgi:hypothetical protein